MEFVVLLIEKINVYALNNNIILEYLNEYYECYERYEYYEYYEFYEYY